MDGEDGDEVINVDFKKNCYILKETWRVLQLWQEK